MTEEKNEKVALTKPKPAELVPIGEKGIELRSLEELLKFARMAVSSGAAPKSMSDGAAAIAIQAGLERGLGLLGGLQHIVVINGVLSWRGQGAFALVQNSGKCKPGTLKMGCRGEGDQRIGWAEAWRVGYGEPSTATFTVKDARQAGLWGKSGPWQQYPDRMLMWRAFGFLVRDVFPDVLGGFPLAEEAEDFEPIKPTANRPPIKAELPAPSAPDPLLQELGVQEKRVEPIEAEVAQEPELSHEEADKEIAESEGLFS